MSKSQEEAKLVTMKRWQVLVMTVIAGMTTIGTAFAAYLKMNSTSTKAVIEARLVESKLEQERSFVRKDQFDRLSDKVDEIGRDTSWVRGYLQRKQRRADGE